MSEKEFQESEIPDVEIDCLIQKLWFYEKCMVFYNPAKNIKMLYKMLL